jgi:hypothetical protein
MISFLKVKIVKLLCRPKITDNGLQLGEGGDFQHKSVCGARNPGFWVGAVRQSCFHHLCLITTGLFLSDLKNLKIFSWFTSISPESSFSQNPIVSSALNPAL